MRKGEIRALQIAIRRTDGVYFSQDHGTFRDGKIKGSICSTVGSGAIIVSIDGEEREVYEVRTEDMVKAVLAEREAKETVAASTSLESAIEAARKADGDTVFALVSPRQAERLYLALAIADGLANADTSALPRLHAVVERYRKIV